MVRLILIGKRIYNKFSEDEMTVYAAQVSFFVILSVVPFLMLLLTAVQMIPGISKADFLEIAMDIVPADYRSLAFRVVNDLMLKSPATMISATAITALWSAGRGMFSVARGLNRVNGRGRKHWYVFNRLICCGYTILFIAVYGPSCVWTNASKLYPESFSADRTYYRLCDPDAPAMGLWHASCFLPGDLLSGSGPERKRQSCFAGGCIFHSWLDAFFSCIFHVFQFYRREKLFLYVWQSCSYCVVIFVALYLHMHPVYGSGIELVLG